MKQHQLLYSILILITPVFILSCGSGSLTDMANDNLYAYKHANKTSVPEVAENGFKDFDLKFNDGEQDLAIHGWYFTKSKFAPTVIYLHGNATNIGSLNSGGILNALKALEANVVVIDYPSYGKSVGTPTMKSLTTSAGEAVRWASNKYKGDIFVWGRSLGTGVTAQVVSKFSHLVDGYILTSPWTTVKALIKHHFNSLADQVPKDWLAANSYDSVEALKDSKKPVLIFHGDKDEVIPYKFGVQLHDSLADKRQAQFVTLNGFEHNDIFQNEEMWKGIKEFIF